MRILSTDNIVEMCIFSKPIHESPKLSHVNQQIGGNQIIIKSINNKLQSNTPQDPQNKTSTKQTKRYRLVKD